MKKYLISLLLLPLFAFATPQIILSPEWHKGPAKAPTLFTASKFEKGKVVNSINIFKMDSSKKSVIELKGKIQSGKLTNVGEGYLIRNQQSYNVKGCYLLDVENARSKRTFNQIWCFPGSEVIVLQTTDYNGLHPKTRKSITGYFESRN